MSACPAPRRWPPVAVCLVLAAALGGCAELMLISSAAALVTSLPAQQARWVETNRLGVGAPAAEVYALLEQDAEHDGLEIVARDAAERVLTVSYPFSLLQNNWGGRIRIRCLASDFGTTVTIESDGRDSLARMRTLGDDVLARLDGALRRLPRSL